MAWLMNCNSSGKVLSFLVVSGDIENIKSLCYTAIKTRQLNMLNAGILQEFNGIVTS